MKVFRLLLAGIIFSVSVNAAAGNKWTGETTVTSLLSNSNGSLYVSITGALPLIVGCNNKTSLYLNGIKSAGAKGMHADILAAQVSGFKVNFGVSDTECSSGYRVITAVKVVSS